MNSIIFFKAIPSSLFYEAGCALILWGIIFIILTLKGRAYLPKLSKFSTLILKTVVLIFFVLYPCFLGLKVILVFAHEKINPDAREELFAVSEDGIIFAWNYCCEEKLSVPYCIPWNSISLVWLENYRHSSGRGSHYSFNKLCFYSEYSLMGSIDSYYIENHDFDFLFKCIRQFYKGPIIKEYQRGYFMTLINEPSGLLVWKRLDDDHSDVIKEFESPSPSIYDGMSGLDRVIALPWLFMNKNKKILSSTHY